MNVFFAHQQIDAGNGKDDGKQYNGRRRRVGGEAAAVAVEHVVDVAHNGVHARRIQIRAEQRHRITVRLERADEAGDYQIKNIGEIMGRVIRVKVRSFEVPSTRAAL